MDAQASVDGARIASDALNRGVDGCKRAPRRFVESQSLGGRRMARELLSRSLAPVWVSKLRRSLLTAGWETPRSAAAAVIEPLSTMRTKARRADATSMHNH